MVPWLTCLASCPSSYWDGFTPSRRLLRPHQGDRNGNPFPGTLVETGCTHPFEFNFYLCSRLNQGHCSSNHYQCIMNEGNWNPAELHSSLFEHSYQYVRSTIPVRSTMPSITPIWLLLALVLTRTSLPCAANLLGTVSLSLMVCFISLLV